MRECCALCLAASLCRAMRLRSNEPPDKRGIGWEPSAAGGLHVRRVLGLFLNRGLVPQAKPGPLWSWHVCQAIPQGQSHLAVDDERMQHGHFNCVQATPLTKVDLAASLTFWHVARGHCSMKEVGVGDRCPIPSEQEVSFCNLRASFSAKAVARIDCSGSSQGQFWGSRKEEGMAFHFLNFLPGLFNVRSWLCMIMAASALRHRTTCTQGMRQSMP